MSLERISAIVRAVKDYSYLDQAPIQDVDLREGLENTLVILAHKIKGGIRIKREYATDLPRIEAYASELNQVWTNVIDNAIDAMNGEGEIRLKASIQDAHAVVEICDTGPGIPPEVQRRMFEPFFTTKPPGIGTGLGLHISYNIVVQRHGGRIEVSSQPGETCFKVILPLRLSRASS
jgi:signal transduction histidine kinase